MKPFIAQYKPKETDHEKPILVGREYSQARISIADAERLIDELALAVKVARLDAAEYFAE